jgi:hypothetical protein
MLGEDAGLVRLKQTKAFNLMLGEVHVRDALQSLFRENKITIVLKPGRTVVKECTFHGSLTRAILRMFRLCKIYPETLATTLKKVTSTSVITLSATPHTQQYVTTLA